MQNKIFKNVIYEGWSIQLFKKDNENRPFVVKIFDHLGQRQLLHRTRDFQKTISKEVTFTNENSATIAAQYCIDYHIRGGTKSKAELSAKRYDEFCKALAAEPEEDVTPPWDA